MGVVLLFLGIALLLAGGGALYLALVKPYVLQQRMRQGLRLKVYRITLPQHDSQNDEHNQDPTELISVMEQLYTSFTSIKEQGGFFQSTPHISLEMVNPAKEDEIQFFIGVPRDYVSILEKQIYGQYPGAEIEEASEYHIFTSEGQMAASRVTTSQDNLLPIRTYDTFQADPLNQITSALSKINRNESAGIQMLIRPTSTQTNKAKRIVSKMQEGYSYKEAKREQGVGGVFSQITKSKQKSAQESRQPTSLSPRQEEIMKAIDTKGAKSMFQVNMRLLAVADEQSRAMQLLQELEGSLAQFSSSDLNGLKIKRIPKRKLTKFVYTFLFRVFERANTMRLNTEELTTLYHLPTPFLETPKIRWLKFKKAHPPSHIPTEGLTIGQNTYRGETTEINLQKSDRRRHAYIIGQTGTGKSALLKKMIQQDLHNGEGVAVLDPNGDLAEEVLSLVPKERAEDVIYFNPQDTERPLGLNILEAHTAEEKDFITQEMISIFYKLVSDPSMIGPIFEHNMRNAMLALMADPHNPGTIVEIPRLFTDEEFRKEVLKNVDDPMVREFWEKEFPKSQTGQQAGDIIGYLLSKLGRFIENEMIRNIIGQKESSFNFDTIMNERKILICNLSKGGLGEINSSLLGMLMVSKLQMAAFRRNSLPEEERKDFYLYLDEFQNFTTDSISTILSEARKYRLNLTIAHQFIGQLEESIKSSVFGNVGTSIVLRVGTDDAQYLENKVQPQFSAYDLSRLDNLNAVVALMIQGETSKPFNMEILFAKSGDRTLQEALVELSRLKYGTKKSLVARDIKRRAQIG